MPDPQHVTQCRHIAILATTAAAVPAAGSDPVTVWSLISSQLTDEKNTRAVGGRVVASTAALIVGTDAALVKAGSTNGTYKMAISDEHEEPAIYALKDLLITSQAGATSCTVVVYLDDMRLKNTSDVGQFPN